MLLAEHPNQGRLVVKRNICKKGGRFRHASRSKPRQKA